MKIAKNNRYEKVSVAIPTLQKNKTLLDNLVTTLSEDEGISEIIVIDNSLNGYEHPSDKLRVIVPEDNIFVNPGWNLGVKEAREDIVALLNDDIKIPDNFCSRIADKITPDMGIVGYIKEYVKECRSNPPKPEVSEIILEKTDGRCNSFGTAMFFYKSSYYDIPEEMKIYFGNDWLIYKNIKAHKQNYIVKGQYICQYDGLTTGSSKKYLSQMKKERRLYKRHTRQWWNYIFSIEPMYKRKRIIILGIKISISWDK